MSTLAACVECGHPRDHYGLVRGHCHTCYTRHYRDGTYVDLTRARTRADVADEYAHLRSYGMTRAQVAERIGMRRDTLDQTLRRAALDGDSRIDYQPRRVPRGEPSIFGPYSESLAADCEDVDG